MKKFSYPVGPQSLKKLVSRHGIVAGAAGIELAVNRFLLDSTDLQESPAIIEKIDSPY